MIGHSFGSRGRGIKRGAISHPSQLQLTGWWPASFSASPWAGAASAGSSGGRDLSEGTNPPGTVTVGAFTGADSDGTDDVLSTSEDSSAFFATNSMSGVVLVNLDAAGSINSDATPYQENHLMGSAGNADWGLSLSNADTSSVRFWRQRTGAAAYDSVKLAMATGAWRAVQFSYNGTNLRMRLDNGLWSSTAATANALSGTSQNIFFGHALSARSNAKILEIMWSNQVFSDSTFDTIYAYLKDRYPSAGLT